MGAVFSLPWTRLEEWYGALPALHQAGFTTVALTPAEDAADLAAVAVELAAEKVALVVGSEGPGLTARWLRSADRRAGIPMANGIDSLNVAAAAAIAFYAFAQPSGAPTGQSGG
jgi:tRNA G18 (ribose-2'-O)-methylase SpoU